MWVRSEHWLAGSIPHWAPGECWPSPGWGQGPGVLTGDKAALTASMPWHRAAERCLQLVQRSSSCPLRCASAKLFLISLQKGRKKHLFPSVTGSGNEKLLGEEVAWLCANICEWWMALTGKVSQPITRLNRDNKGAVPPCLSSLLWQCLHTSFLRLRSFMLE